jgi:beta-fructofuranosidase
MNHADFEHRQLIEQANVSVAQASARAARDPLRPRYHLMSASRWIGDPNGPIAYHGEYHMFFQHNPYADSGERCSWGHAKSSDLAHWERLPIALTNGPQDYDSMHVASGCCVVHDGLPTILYTGMSPHGHSVTQKTMRSDAQASPADQLFRTGPLQNGPKQRSEVQCIAHSHDGMVSWTKHARNPVVARPPRDDLVGFRDPFAWREQDTWYIVVGSGIKGEGGTALLYRSKDLTRWEYMHPLCVGFGEMWECPNFFPLGDKHVLVVSPYESVRYAIGTYRDHHFSPESWHELDLGGRPNFYAPNGLEDDRGRRIVWGWIQGGGTEGYPWDGALTLPRILTLRSDGRLGMSPAAELRTLRGSQVHIDDVLITPETPNLLGDIEGKSLEIIVEFELLDATSFGLLVRRSPDGEEGTPVGYDTARKQLISGDRSGAFDLLADEDTLCMQVFVDNSIIEIYVNGRICFTNRVYPRRPDSLGLSLFAHGGSVRVKSLDCWEMHALMVSP